MAAGAGEDHFAVILAGMEDHIDTAVEAAAAVGPFGTDKMAGHERAGAVAVVEFQRCLAALIDLGFEQDFVVVCVAEVFEESEDSVALLQGVSEVQVHLTT